MPSLYAYRKHIDAIHTHELKLPDSQGQDRAGHELCTLPDGRTVVVLFDGAELPADQPEKIKASIEALPKPLPDDLRDQIRAASPQIQLINRRLVEIIRSKYTPDDESYLTRIACGQALGSYQMSAGEMQMVVEYQKTAEGARAWAKEERTKLGL